jgi:hypothetical protein
MTEQNAHLKRRFILRDWPKVVVEGLTLLLLIREIPDSNLAPETGSPD